MNYFQFLILFFSGYKIVCYYEGWAVYRKDPMTFTSQDIDPKMCTHLIYSFAGLEGNQIVSLDTEEDIENGGYTKVNWIFKLFKSPILIGILIVQMYSIYRNLQ